MADPVTLTAISVGSTVLGGLTSAFGSAKAGGANASMYEYQSGVAKVNQQIAVQNRDYTRTVGEVEAGIEGLKQRQIIGGIKAAKGASGFAVNSGTNVDVVESQEATGAYDQAVIRSNAARRAYGYDVEAKKDEAQAGMYGRAASNAREAGTIGAIGSLLGTAGSVAGKWLDASRLGVGTNPTNVGSAVQMEA